jgi:hypothetical protein
MAGELSSRVGRGAGEPGRVASRPSGPSRLPHRHGAVISGQVKVINADGQRTLERFLFDQRLDVLKEPEPLFRTGVQVAEGVAREEGLRPPKSASNSTSSSTARR